MTRTKEDPLYLDWCSHEAADYATRNWHYTETLPVGKLVKIGVWEHDSFRGAIVYGRGASPPMYESWGMEQTELCELVRVALRDHEHPVSQMLSISLDMLQDRCPGLRVVVSFADPRQDHHGGIYQASNWYYLGTSQPNRDFKIDGKIVHTRSVGATYGTTDLDWIQANVDPDAKRVTLPGKHRYAYPLTDAMRDRLEDLQQPYPDRAGSVEGTRPPDQAGAGGSNPTPAHSPEEAA